jgi:hypothetical protein
MRLEGLSCHMWSKKNAKERADAACPKLGFIGISCISNIFVNTVREIQVDFQRRPFSGTNNICYV